MEQYSSSTHDPADVVRSHEVAVRQVWLCVHCSILVTMILVYAYKLHLITGVCQKALPRSTKKKKNKKNTHDTILSHKKIKYTFCCWGKLDFARP